MWRNKSLFPPHYAAEGGALGTKLYSSSNFQKQMKAEEVQRKELQEQRKA